MAGPMIKFTEKRREKFAKIVGITNWVCIFPSFICLLLALYIQLVVEDKIRFIEDYNGAILPGFLVFSGFFGLFTHILCGKIAYSNRLPEKRKKWMKFLLPALIATSIIFLAETISGIMCFAHIRSLEESLHAGIQVAMAAYKDDATTKTEVDMLQIEYECCGSRGYKDWFSVSWIHPDYMSDIKSQTSESAESKKLISDDVPFSCCNPQVLRPCIPHHVHDNNLHFNYDYRSGTTLYTKGCTDKLMSFYKNSVLMLAGGLVLILSSIELELMICLRFLQTAVTSSEESDDPEGPSYGYLFGGPQAANADTTIESTEGTTLLDTTADTTLSAENDEFDDERYVEMDPLYENVGHFEVGADEEHIYNEGDVEDYLAGKFARSKEMFEHLSESGYEAAVAPAYMAPPPPPPPVAPPPPPFPDVNYNRSPTTLHEVRSNYGRYMAMNISNSSPITAKKVTRRHRKQHKMRVKRQPFPSPVNRPKDTFIINMRQNKSPSTLPSFNGPTNTDPERRRLLDCSPPNFSKRSPSKGKNMHGSKHSFFEPHCSYKHCSTQSSPYKILPNRPNSGIYPDMLYSVYGKRRSPQKKSPDRRISPQKTIFKSGVSYQCNHAYD